MMLDLIKEKLPGCYRSDSGGLSPHCNRLETVAISAAIMYHRVVREAQLENNFGSDDWDNEKIIEDFFDDIALLHDHKGNLIVYTHHKIHNKKIKCFSAAWSLQGESSIGFMELLCYDDDLTYYQE